MFLLFLTTQVLDTLGLRVAVILDALWAVRRHPGPRAPVEKTVLAGILLLVAFGAHSRALQRFVVETVKIPSGSMIPTLIVGDHVVVDKLRSPARGDLLVFPFPEHPDQQFLKRVVGLPGDRLEFRAGHPVINGVEVPSCYVGRASYDDRDSPIPKHEGKIYLEMLGHHPHLTFYDESVGLYGEDNWGPYAVKGDEVFVVGDNRWNAHDSRMWHGGQGGGVPVATMNGVPFVVGLSVHDQSVDWSRMGLDLSSPHLPTSMAALQPALDACLAKNGL